MHDAASEGMEDAITVLTGRGASLNATDHEGNTPLHVAAKWGHSQTVLQLLDLGALDSLKNKDHLLYSDLVRGGGGEGDGGGGGGRAGGWGRGEKGIGAD